MKQLIFFALVLFAAWNYYTKNIRINDSAREDTPASFENKELASVTIPQPKDRCDGRQYCSEMSSYEEAKYFIENCPDTKMDGDGDGIPCERQFNR